MVKKEEDVTSGALCKEGRGGKKNLKALGRSSFQKTPGLERRMRERVEGGGEKW